MEMKEHCFLVRLFCILFTVVFALSNIAVLAESYELIQVETLKEIEAKDTFPVKIVEKKMKMGGAADAIFENNDSLSLAIENSGIESVQNINMYIVAYNEEHKPCSLSIIKARYPYVQVLSTEKDYGDPLIIEPGKTKKVHMDCHGTNIAGIRAIIVSYETTDGEVHENLLAKEWLSNVTGSKSYELD